jgi:hypothetical protein
MDADLRRDRTPPPQVPTELKFRQNAVGVASPHASGLIFHASHANRDLQYLELDLEVALRSPHDEALQRRKPIERHLETADRQLEMFELGQNASAASVDDSTGLSIASFVSARAFRKDGRARNRSSVARPLVRRSVVKRYCAANMSLHSVPASFMYASMSASLTV